MDCGQQLKPDGGGGHGLDDVIPHLTYSRGQGILCKTHTNINRVDDHTADGVDTHLLPDLRTSSLKPPSSVLSSAWRRKGGGHKQNSRCLVYTDCCVADFVGEVGRN